jgi:hypothetical protein
MYINMVSSQSFLCIVAFGCRVDYMLDKFYFCNLSPLIKLQNIGIMMY